MESYGIVNFLNSYINKMLFFDKVSVSQGIDRNKGFDVSTFLKTKTSVINFMFVIVVLN